MVAAASSAAAAVDDDDDDDVLGNQINEYAERQQHTVRWQLTAQSNLQHLSSLPPPHDDSR